MQSEILINPDFERFKDSFINLIFAEFSPSLVIICLAVFAFLFLIVQLIFLCFICKPKTTSNPRCFSIFCYIIFSLIFFGSLVYLVFSLILYPSFQKNFPKIPYYIEEGVKYASDELQYFHSNISQFLDKTLAHSNAETFGTILDLSKNEVFYISEPLSLMKEAYTTISDHSSQLSQKIQTVNSYCSSEFSFSSSHFSPLSSYLSHINDYTDKLIDAMNRAYLNTYFMTDIKNAFNYPTFKPNNIISKIDQSLNQYINNDLQNARSSFDSDNIVLKYVFFILFCVFALGLIVLFIFQTIVFPRHSSFSRKSITCLQIIYFILAIIVGCGGIISTFLSGAIENVCSSGPQFASDWYSAKALYSNLTFPNFTSDLFNPENSNSLYNLTNMDQIFDFPLYVSNITNLVKSASSHITQKAIDKVLKYYEELITSFQTESISDYRQNLNEFENDLKSFDSEFIASTCYTEHKTSDEVVAVKNELSSYIKKIQNIKNIQSESDVANEMIKLSKLKQFSSQSGNDFIEAFKQSVNEYFDYITSKITNAGISCPYNNVETTFCYKSGGCFSLFAIFSHFFLISIIGFSIIFCLRRPNMADAIDLTEKNKEFIYRSNTSQNNPTKTSMLDDDDHNQNSGFLQNDPGEGENYDEIYTGII